MTTMYPTPPPTSNTLTAQQREHLIRSTNKLGRVLGSTPRLLDAGLDRPERDEVCKPRKRGRPRALTLSDGKVLDLSSTSSPYYLTNLMESYTHARSSSDSSACSDASTSSSPTLSPSEESPRKGLGETWRIRHVGPTEHKPPLLKLAMSLPAAAPRSTRAAVKPALETIPASPLGPLSFNQNEAPAPAAEPVFRIPSQAAVRRTKMERVRRTLGECVPVALVFPEDDRAGDLRSAVPRPLRGRPITSVHPRLDAIVEAPSEHGPDPDTRRAWFGGRRRT